jgi:hypothetical protein
MKDAIKYPTDRVPDPDKVSGFHQRQEPNKLERIAKQIEEVTDELWLTSGDNLSVDVLREDDDYIYLNLDRKWSDPTNPSISGVWDKSFILDKGVLLSPGGRVDREYLLNEMRQQQERLTKLISSIYQSLDINGEWTIDWLMRDLYWDKMILDDVEVKWNELLINFSIWLWDFLSPALTSKKDKYFSFQYQDYFNSDGTFIKGKEDIFMEGIRAKFKILYLTYIVSKDDLGDPILEIAKKLDILNIVWVDEIFLEKSNSSASRFLYIDFDHREIDGAFPKKDITYKIDLFDMFDENLDIKEAAVLQALTTQYKQSNSEWIGRDII